MIYRVWFLVFALYLSPFAFSQDGAYVGYNLAIRFEGFEPADSMDSILYVEFYKDADWIESPEDLKNRSRGLVKYDLKAAYFQLSEGVSFIGSSPKTIKPPTIIMKIGMRRNFGAGETIDHVKIIPIVFDTPLKNFAQISLTGVNINSYLKIPSDQIAIKVLSSGSFEIVTQKSLETQPVINTLIRFD